MILYECKIRYERQTGEDIPGQVNETYVIEGVSPTDVEKRLIDELHKYISGDSETTSIKKKKFADIFPNAEGGTWFNGKVEMITIEDDKEKRQAVNILIQSHNFSAAVRDLYQNLAGLDCEIVSVTRTPIIEVWRAVVYNNTEPNPGTAE